MTPSEFVFDERQTPSRGWYAFGASAVALVVGYALLRWDRLGDTPWRFLVVPGVAALIVVAARMRTVVTRTHLRITVVPFVRKTTDLADLEHCEPVTYRPLMHYGGWGCQWSPSRGWAYTMRGNRGVMVHRRDGKRFLIGSQRPDELAGAILSVTRGRRSGA